MRPANAGVTAQKLRYVDLLLTTPIKLTLARNGLIPVEQHAEILVANPLCLIAQKLLIADRRPPEKRAQDVLYVHDTIELFAANLTRLNEHWRASVQRTLHKSTCDGTTKNLQRVMNGTAPAQQATGPAPSEYCST